jgi:hypothetical protein
LLTFEGVNLTESGCGCQPPDSDGDVGPNHYVNAVNLAFRVFDKNGNPLSPVTQFSSFFAPLGGGCAANQNKTSGHFTISRHASPRGGFLFHASQLFEFANVLVHLKSRWQLHRKRESQHHATGCETLRCRFQSIIYPRSRHAENITTASLLDVDLTHPFLLANDLDLIA